MTRKQERFVRTVINIALGKNGGYMSSSLGGRSISVGRQAVSEMKILQFNNFNSVSFKAYLSCLNRFMVLNSSVERDLWPILKDMLLYGCFPRCSKVMVFLINPYS